MVASGARRAVAVIGGGAHHAGFAHGAGYCVFNDVAIASVILKSKGLRVGIVDLDVHQGDGTIEILNHLGSDIPVLDLSAKSNFPFRKQVPNVGSSLMLEDNMKDDEYLRIVKTALDEFKMRFGKFDCIVYQAGVDPLESDRLGRLSLSLQGLAARDELVYTFCKNAGMISTCGGGYYEKGDVNGLNAVVEAHTQQIDRMAKYFE